MMYEVGVFNRIARPTEKTREVEDEHTDSPVLDQAEAEELAESPLPPDPGTFFPFHGE